VTDPVKGRYPQAVGVVSHPSPNPFKNTTWM
ncbi:unnamed protein product, partial [marine sediment metagenome]